MNYPQGSIWRKWDLHVHTPASYLNSQFPDNWDEYVKGGSIENPTIRERAIKVLEGGSEAFRQRKQKYRLF